MFCKNCGKELNDHAIFCPGCGVATTPTTDVKEQNSIISSMVYNIYAIIGLICSFIVPILGIIFGCLGYSFATKNNENGKNMSIASIIISGISMLSSLLFFILILTI